MKEIKELKTKLISLDKITPYENNAKEHPDWQIAQIKNSIEQFGFNDPIAVNENMGIIEGHGRYLAAKELGLKEVPCIILSGMTADEERAYKIAHNKLTMNTGFNLEVLEYELNALKVEDFNLSLTGFSEEELLEMEENLPEDMDIPHDEEEIGGENTNLNTLKFGNIKCKMTDEELQMLVSKYNKHVEEKGTDYGFITDLFEEMGA